MISFFSCSKVAALMPMLAHDADALHVNARRQNPVGLKAVTESSTTADGVAVSSAAIFVPNQIGYSIL